MTSPAARPDDRQTPLIRLDQSVVVGVGGGRRPRRSTELGEDVADRAGDCLLADEKRVGDLSVVLPSATSARISASPFGSVDVERTIRNRVSAPIGRTTRVALGRIRRSVDVLAPIHEAFRVLTARFETSNRESTCLGLPFAETVSRRRSAATSSTAPGTAPSATGHGSSPRPTGPGRVHLRHGRPGTRGEPTADRAPHPLADTAQQRSCPE